MKFFTSKIFLASIGVLIIIWALFLRQEKKIVHFTCEGGSTIRATFYPEDDKRVSLTLSDGRMMVLAHGISASGARYVNKDESVVFWNKGDTAFLTELGTTTYALCAIPTHETETATTTSATTTPPKKPVVTKPKSVSSSFTRSYANGEYGFSMKFPASVTSQGFFTTFYELASNWRVNAALNNQGKAVVSFPVHRIDQGTVATGKAYPLFFIAEVRVGVSPNVKECYTPDAGYASQKITNVVINGVTFKRFSFQDAGMMKQMQGESYRTIHNNMCYVLEQIRHQSTYKDSTMKEGVSEATLTSYYQTAEAIIKTFVFTR